MRCVEPYVVGKGAFGCGKCLPCRRAKQREWTHRLMLEGLCHADKSFVTLTYSQEKCPDELRPDHLRDFLKRLRWRVRPAKLRYYGVGEYGSRTGRPHYHLALFGFPPCGFAGSRQLRGECPCVSCSIVRETWGFGFISVSRLESRSAAYIAKYVLKKMTRVGDPRLNGRHPEFARMSNGGGGAGTGGIGANAMWDVASEMMRYPDRYLKGDVPLVLPWSKAQVMPLGRYLRSRLRKMVGKDEKAPPEALQKLANQMQIVRSFAWNADRSVSSVFKEINGPYEHELLARVERGIQNETL